MAKALLHILWDDSQIWGLLAARAASAMGLPHRLVRAADIAGGLLARERPSLLLVPGGTARHKAASLGPSGLAAIRDYVEGGGQYLGFCGGAGLALSARGRGDLIGICPWQRGGFEERMQHFMSGHLHVALPAPGSPGQPLIPAGGAVSPRLPVWWPGRFAPMRGGDITVLASYDRPADDFWLIDLPIADLPPDTFAAWRDMHGLNLSPGFLSGQPCMLHGRSGKGGYLLSYSHLETPDSPEANAWLAHILRVLGNLAPAVDRLPPWRIHGKGHSWDDKELEAMERALAGVLQTGLRHGLLFTRTDWLLGWRAGIPGASLNNLWAALRVIRETEPGNRALAFWKARAPRVAEAARLFCEGCLRYLLDERLAMTLAGFLPDTLPRGMLRDQREALFGPPMHAGGLYREIMEPLDALAFLQLA